MDIQYYFFYEFPSRVFVLPGDVYNPGRPAWVKAFLRNKIGGGYQ
jgi:hypothetical protein